LGSASSARGFAEDLRALVAACSEGRAQVTPTRPNPATPQGSAGQQAGASDCFVPDLEPAAIISACNAIITAQAQRLLGGGTPPPLPEQVRPLLHRSTAYQRSNDHRRAIEDLSTIIRLAPNVAMGYFLRGSARRLANQPEAALQDIDAGLRIAPANREGRLSRAGVLIDLGREREALEATDALASSAPDFAHAHNLACWIRAAYHGRELDQARRSCDEAIRLAPTEPSFYDSRGMVGLKQERWREAWQDYGRAVQLDATSAHALFGRGIAALRLGRTAEGNADLAEAIRLDASITGQYDRYGIVR
jgi:tetratricopeptide (TPR) repeat protein